MSARTFFGWLAVTAVTVVLAIVVLLDRGVSTFNPVDREPVFSELRDAPDSVQRLFVNSRFGEFTLVREGDDWIAPDRYDYPVESADIRRLVASLADMRYVERKTAKPERFPRLEVEDIEDVDSESILVQLYGPGNEVLADIIVGRPSARFFGGSSSGTYIREPGTNNVWLASGNVSVQQRLIPWLQRTIVSVPANTVASIALGSGDGAVTLAKQSADDEQFSVAGGIGENEELDERAATGIGRALAKVELEDVKPRSELALPGDAGVAKVTTFGGLEVTVRLAQIDKKPWAVFDAAYVGDAGDDSDAAREARAKADEINARAGNWAYWVPSATFESLTSTRGKLVKEKDDKSS